MKKFAVIIGLGLMVVSCGTQKGVKTSDVGNTTSNVSASSSIIKNVLNKNPDFKHLLIKSKITADLGDMNTGIDATIYIDNQEKIWINAQKFIFKARAVITPTGFQAYENMSKSYVDGDFKFVNQLLGVDFIDYQKFQNLLLGRVFVDMTDTNFDAQKKDNQYIINYKNNASVDAKSKNEYYQTYTFDSGFRLKQALLKYPAENMEVQISYDNWVKADKVEMPKNVKILVKDKKTKEFDLEYNSFTYQQTDTPFSIPSGYKKREIK